ncbi:flagellar FlbD family protein [Clostridium fallax]|uniref:Flagellar protein FlbD n=1 Tax=Clostridium fallax TaxID=1533 RepID=A0A1M4UJC9_9CLOT|nr:flagellar FlbD family protein [Clostridium fallax]SHE56846.1 flagellar protein FlbD [Clostridium fallax]SQB07598.1 uncharacterized protein, possibly involved in motility [Clostridium fallax]
MIKLTSINNDKFILNVDNIEKIEQISDTIITLTSGKKFRVKEDQDEIVDKVVAYKKRIFNSK